MGKISRYSSGSSTNEWRNEKKVKKECLSRVKLLARSKLYAGNIISGINAWAIGVVRYSSRIMNGLHGT